jgi:hypothetical protein
MSDANGMWEKRISMLQNFHFKIVHRLGSTHSNVDVLSMDHVFVLDEKENFQAEVPNQTIVISKATMESGKRSLHDRTKIHEIENIFTLSKVTQKRLEQLAEKKLIGTKAKTHSK